jgi:hypothetical protein
VIAIDLVERLVHDAGAEPMNSLDGALPAQATVLAGCLKIETGSCRYRGVAVVEVLGPGLPATGEPGRFISRRRPAAAEIVY